MAIRSRILIGTVLGLAFATRAPEAQPGFTLTDQDRMEIQALVAHYTRALNTCAAEQYADLFATPGGYFASGTRGEVRERQNLIAMVHSEPRCLQPAVSPAGARGAQPAAGGRGGAERTPVINIEPAPQGARGVVRLGAGSRYEDVYVKTPQGWRFKSRNVVTDAESAAGLSSRDFIEIRELAGDDHGHYDDVYGAKGEATPARPNESRPFRASGLMITATPEGATGKAFLRNNGGSYEDVYVKTAEGWRIKSRTYVPPSGQSGVTQSRRSQAK